MNRRSADDDAPWDEMDIAHAGQIGAVNSFAHVPSDDKPLRKRPGQFRIGFHGSDRGEPGEDYGRPRRKGKSA